MTILVEEWDDFFGQEYCFFLKKWWLFADDYTDSALFLFSSECLFVVKTTDPDTEKNAD